MGLEKEKGRYPIGEYTVRVLRRILSTSQWGMLSGRHPANIGVPSLTAMKSLVLKNKINLASKKRWSALDPIIAGLEEVTHP